MSESFWKRINYIFGLTAVAFFFGLIVFMTSIEVKDLDLWLHLATGRYIVHNGFVPGYDVLSCSIAGKPWVNHEWLFQVLVYLIFQGGGPDALITMQSVVVVATFMIFFFLCYSKEKQFPIAFLLLVALLVYSSRFTIRPDIFSLLFFAVYIFVLSTALDRRWSIPVLLVTQILWSNMHGFFFLGPFIILLAIVSEFVKRRIPLPFEWNTSGRLEDGEYLRLKWIFVVVSIGCVFNPLFLEGAIFPLKVLTQLSGESKIFFEHIQELQKPVLWSNVFSLDEFPQYKLLILLSFLSIVFNFRKMDIGVFAFWLFFLFFSLAAKRNIVFFAFASYLVCMNNLVNLSWRDFVPVEFVNPKFEYITAILLKLTFCLWILNWTIVLADRGYFDFDTYERKSEYWGISKRNYPEHAANFLVDNKVKGNFFNDFNSGAYLLGRCFPDIHVFIDGRTEVYGPRFFKQYQKLWNDGNTEYLDQALEKFHFTGAFLNSAQAAIPSKTLNYFLEKGWPIVYLDYDAVIFLRDKEGPGIDAGLIKQNKEIIAKFGINPAQWKAEQMDLRRLGAISVIPYQQTNRAYTLQDMGFDEGAMQEALNAINVCPGYVEPYKILGKVYGKRKDYEKAFENFRIVTMISPSNTEGRYNLALAYENLQDFKNAVKQYEKILRYTPQDAKAFFKMAHAYAQDGQYNKMLETLATARRLDPADSIDLLKIGDVAYSAKGYQSAKEVFTMALSVKKDLADVHYKLGLCYQSLNQEDSAKKEFEEGLKIDPDHPELKESLKKSTVSPAQR